MAFAVNNSMPYKKRHDTEMQDEQFKHCNELSSSVKIIS